MAKLIITDAEISMIKGLIRHTNFNDQQIHSIFTYLDRNLNQRVIGSIRKGVGARYAASPTATPRDVQAYLKKYSALMLHAIRAGFLPSDKNRIQVIRSIDLMRTAVFSYNNGVIPTRSEAFIVLAVIAWTYVLHSYFRSRLVSPVFKDRDGSVIKMASGQPKHWDLSYCIKRQDSPLTPGTRNNLLYLTALRNDIEHQGFEEINEEVQSKVQAATLNFVEFCTKHFGDKYDISNDLSFTIQLASLQIKDAKAGASLSLTIAAANALVERDMSAEEYNDPAYAFRVHVVPKVSNNQKNSDQAVTFSPVGSAIEMAIKHVEKPKRRASEVITLLRERGHVGLTSHKFTSIWKAHGLKQAAKGYAIELGNQWFWYDEGIAAVEKLLGPPPPH